MRRRIAIIGPAHPYRGGIAHYVGRLHRELISHHEVQVFNFSRQYPSLFFPGSTQEDRSRAPLAVPSERIIDSIHPMRWLAARRRIAAWKPDLALFMWWHPFFGPALGTIARGLGEVPRIFLCHNVTPHEPSLLDRLLSLHALRSATGFVVHSGIEARRLEDLFPGCPVRLTPLPLYDFLVPPSPPDAASARRSLGLSGDPVLLFFGLIRPYKGLKTLLEAVPLILESRKVTVLVVGEFYEDPAPYRRMVEDGGWGEQVRFIDRFVPDEEVAPYFAAADLVVLPYRTASQSAVVQVAYAFDRPVLVTRTGGLPESVFEGETGHLVEPDRPEELASAVCRFLETPREIYQKGLLRRKSLFGWDRLRTTLESFL
jgi:glycosyltransferase involved in cell wall biosynthesis